MSDINDDLPSEDEDRLVEQMDEVRANLENDIDRLGENMQHLFDWQSYVRSAPLTSVALGAAVGYLLAPSFGSSSAAEARPMGLSGFITKIAMASVAQIASVSLAELLSQKLRQPSGPDSVPSSSAESYIDPGD